MLVVASRLNGRERLKKNVEREDDKYFRRALCTFLILRGGEKRLFFFLRLVEGGGKILERVVKLLKTKRKRTKKNGRNALNVSRSLVGPRNTRPSPRHQFPTE